MVICLEMDIRKHNNRCRFDFIPHGYKGRWKTKLTWRICWGFWSISYYPEPGLREFMRHVESSHTEWMAR